MQIDAGIPRMLIKWEKTFGFWGKTLHTLKETSHRTTGTTCHYIKRVNQPGGMACGVYHLIFGLILDALLPTRYMTPSRQIALPRRGRVKPVKLNLAPVPHLSLTIWPMGLPILFRDFLLSSVGYQRVDIRKLGASLPC